MCILTDVNQIQIGFGLLNVNILLLWLVPSNVLSFRYHIRSWWEKYFIYTCYDIFVAGGEHKYFYNCYNPFSAGGENITYFLQGEHLCTQCVIIKKGENVETCFWWDICDAMSFGALPQAYSRVLHNQDFPKRVANDMFCND